MPRTQPVERSIERLRRQLEKAIENSVQESIMSELENICGKFGFSVPANGGSSKDETKSRQPPQAKKLNVVDLEQRADGVWEPRCGETKSP